MSFFFPVGNLWSFSITGYTQGQCVWVLFIYLLSKAGDLKKKKIIFVFLLPSQKTAENTSRCSITRNIRRTGAGRVQIKGFHLKFLCVHILDRGLPLTAHRILCGFFSCLLFTTRLEHSFLLARPLGKNRNTNNTDWSSVIIHIYPALCSPHAAVYHIFSL